MKRIINIILCFAALTLSAQIINAQKKAETNPVFGKYFSHVTESTTTPDSDGFIRRWSMLEPIKIDITSNRGLTDVFLRESLEQNAFANQYSIVPKEGEKVKIGKTNYVWRNLDSKIYFVNLFRFAEGLNKEVYGNIFWVVTTINCPEEMAGVRFSVGVNSGAIWWINDEEVLVMANDKDLIVDDCMSKRITLKKGENVIRGAVFNGQGMADFVARFVDVNGNPIKNIEVVSKLK